MSFIKNFFTCSTSTANKKVVFVYVLFRVIVIVMLISQILMQQWGDIFTLLLTLALFFIPLLVERVFKIEFPNLMELMILVFIFSSIILGEHGNFYSYFKFWDIALHTISGFLAAGVGFSLVYLLNKNVEVMKLTPMFLSIVAFCFSMMVGVLWELFEFGADRYMNTDMHEDQIVQQINSESIGNEENEIYHIENIQRTIIIGQDDSGELVETVIEDGYLDIGIMDTMKDLFVNLLSAIVFSVLVYLYAKHDKKKYRFIRNFILKKMN